MEFCKSHWERLRDAVDAEGLGALVPDDGEQAVGMLARQLQGEDTVDTFNPLEWAHWSLVFNISDITKYPAVMLEGCPLCWLNLEHERTCLGCELPRYNGFDFWIEKAAESARLKWLTYAS